MVKQNRPSAASRGLSNDKVTTVKPRCPSRDVTVTADAADLVSGADGVAAYRQFLDAEGISCGG